MERTKWSTRDMFHWKKKRRNLVQRSRKFHQSWVKNSCILTTSTWIYQWMLLSSLMCSLDFSSMQILLSSLQIISQWFMCMDSLLRTTKTKLDCTLPNEYPKYLKSAVALMNLKSRRFIITEMWVGLLPCTASALNYLKQLPIIPQWSTSDLKMKLIKRSHNSIPYWGY